MIPKIKILSFAIATVLAMNALPASTVQAGDLDIGIQPASLFAHSESNQNHVLTFTSTSGGKFNSSCPTASLEGTTQGQKINELTVTATYSGNTEIPNCTAFGVASQVLMNGCKYTATGNGQPEKTALVDIVGCTEGKSIEIKTAICTLDIPMQNGLPHVVGVNLTSQEVTLNATVSTIVVRQTGPACPDGNNHFSATGSYTGNMIVKARADNSGQTITRHGHQYQELAQSGGQVSLSAT